MINKNNNSLKKNVNLATVEKNNFLHKLLKSSSNTSAVKIFAIAECIMKRPKF